MNKDQIRFFSKELKKEAGFENHLMDLMSMDPAAMAAAVTMAKINLMNRYGKKIPVLKDALGTHYKGMTHSGLMTGLRGEKGTTEITRALTGAVDSNTPGSYETGLRIGNRLREMGVTPENLLEKKQDLSNIITDLDLPDIDSDTIDSIVEPKRGLNRLYDRLGQPAFRRPKPKRKALP